MLAHVLSRGYFVTITDLLVFDLSDIQGVQFECAGCGASVSLPAFGAGDVPIQCPACRVQWLVPTGDTFQTVNRFVVGLRGVAALMAQANYRVRLQVDRNLKAATKST